MSKLNLPKYKSHKVVGAVEISEIRRKTDGSAFIFPKAEKGAEARKPFEVTRHYMTKHTPKVGGYFVEYEDGYQSFSPADVFEKGYSKVEES